MNKYMQERWAWVEATHAMRDEVLNALTDADLPYTPGGQALTLGALCREMGDVEYSYMASLKTGRQDLAYHNPEPALETSVANLKAWYAALDTDLKQALSDFTDEDLKTKQIARASGYQMPIEMQMDVYLQAALIFVGKASVYLRTMSKALPPSVKEYIW